MEFGFLLYDSRSGSTLASALIDQFEGVTVSREVKYITQILDWPIEIETESDLNALIDHLFSFVQMEEAGIERSKLTAKLSAPMDKKTLIKAVIKHHFRDHEGDFWLIKHAPFRYIDRLKTLFPNVKYLHILRDVRSVHASKKKTIGTHGKPMSTNVIKSCRYWKQKLRKLETVSAPIHHFRYEDLLVNQDETLLQILTHLGISKAEKTGNVSNYLNNIGEAQAALHVNLDKGVLQDRASSWRTELTPNEIRSIENDCKNLLIRWQYPITETRGTATYSVFMLNEILVFGAEVFVNAMRSIVRGNFATRLNYFLGKGK